MSFTKPQKRGASLSGTWYVPKDYQKICIEFGISRPAAGFLLRPGLGKTSIALMIFLLLKRIGVVDELLVLAEKQIMFNVWPAEIQKWEQTRHLKVEILHGPKKGERLYRSADVRLMNYEGLQWLRSQTRWLRAKRRIMLVADESNKFQNTNTVRFRCLRKIIHKFVRRYILTGSPAEIGRAHV